jgi:hypothetical protein
VCLNSAWIQRERPAKSSPIAWSLQKEMDSMNQRPESYQTERIQEPSEFDTTRQTSMKPFIRDVNQGSLATVPSAMLGDQRVFDRPGEVSDSSIYFGIRSP